MNKKKVLFPLSLLSLVAITSTSCNGSGLEHKISSENAVYQADLNHNGKIDDNEKNLTWEDSYDVLLKQASSMSELNKAADEFNIADDEIKRTSLARYEILHEAEELLMSTNTIVPLYNYADPFMIKENVKNIYSTNLGYKFFDKLTGNSNNSYNICVGTKADSFDPGQNTDASTAILLSQVYEGAMRWEKGEVVQDKTNTTYSATLVPGSASCSKKLVTNHKHTGEGYIEFNNCPDLKGEDPENYEGTARWTITLDKGAKWNDGTPVTADDFIYSWNRSSSAIYNESAFGMWCGLFDFIRGYEAWNLFGQQTSTDVNKWTDSGKEAWNSLEEEPIYRETLKKEWDAKFNGINNSIEGTGAAGGMLGVMKGVDGNGNETITVQLVNDCEYFEELLAFPAFFPVKKSNIIGTPTLEKEKTTIFKENQTWWLNRDDKFACNGPLMVKRGKEIDNSDSGKAELVRNEKYRNNEDTTVDAVTFMFIDKDSAIYDSYKSGTLDMIDSMPSSTTQELKKRNDWHMADQIGLFYYIFNVNDNTFDRKKAFDEPQGERIREKYRRIMNLLINRHDLAENVVKSGVTSADGMVSKGITEKCVPTLSQDGNSIVAKRKTDGSLETLDWTSRNKDRHPEMKDVENYNSYWLEKRNPDEGFGGGGFFATYESEKATTTTPRTDRQYEEDAMKKNLEEAYALGKELEAAGTGLKVIGNAENFTFENFPSVTLSTNSGTGLEDLAERIQSYYGLFGIDISIETQEWQSFSATRRMGDYAFARHGWVADYNDPRTYLDLCRSTDGNNDTQLGKSAKHKSH